MREECGMIESNFMADSEKPGKIKHAPIIDRGAVVLFVCLFVFMSDLIYF